MTLLLFFSLLLLLMLSIAKKMEQKMGKGCFIFSQTETKN
tara:strand:+ start:1785 stop:1904 length:120 start_codon:yes stop_codon:yes gene_type:complete